MSRKFERREVPGKLSRQIWEEEQEYLTTGLTTLTYEMPIAFEKAENDVLWDVDGMQYIDLSGGTLTISTGHCNKNVVQAVTNQLNSLWNIHDHPTMQRLEALKKLRNLIKDKEYVFQFYNGGTETIEAALRAALSSSGIRRQRIVSFKEGYHGKSRGSIMAVHPLYGRLVQPNYLAPLSLPFPKCYRCPHMKDRSSCEMFCAHEAVRMLEAEKSVGVFVFEPILGSGGIYGFPEGYWEIVYDACKKLGILIIADEITTGAYRTGTFLASERLDFMPDLIAFGKGIGSGFPTMVLGGKRHLLCNDPSQNTAKSLIPGQNFRGPDGASTTFGGNPIALAAINATLNELEHIKIEENVLSVGQVLKSGFETLMQSNEIIGDVRGWGLLLGVELVLDRESKEPAIEEALELYRECAKHGLLIKVDKKGIVHVTPPLTLTRENAIRALEIFEYCISNLGKNR